MFSLMSALDGTYLSAMSEHSGDQPDSRNAELNGTESNHCRRGLSFQHTDGFFISQEERGVGYDYLSLPPHSRTELAYTERSVITRVLRPPCLSRP